MGALRRCLIAVTSSCALVAGMAGLTTPAAAAPVAVDPTLAAPYLYLGWGSPPNPVSVMSATGVKSYTMAFILSDGGCTPKWDGNRSLTGNDATVIRNIRAAGGDVVPSFGGWAGNKLGDKCSSASTLAAAYQKVIDAYALKAIDIDIEDTEFSNTASQDKVLGALKLVKERNPGIKTVITMPVLINGPEAKGKRLITRAKELGANVDTWTIMPFNFNGGTQMYDATVRSSEGLKTLLKSTFGLSDDQAYRKMGISSMNGKTDVGETVVLAQFKQMRDYAAQHHLARFTFWALNRDRGNCGGSSDTCSGIPQNLYDFTKVVAGFNG